MINTIDCKQDLEWIKPIFRDKGNADDVIINDVITNDNEIYRKPSLLDTAFLQSLVSYKKTILLMIKPTQLMPITYFKKIFQDLTHK